MTRYGIFTHYSNVPGVFPLAVEVRPLGECGMNFAEVQQHVTEINDRLLGAGELERQRNEATAMLEREREQSEDLLTRYNAANERIVALERKLAQANRYGVAQWNNGIQADKGGGTDYETIEEWQAAVGE